MASIAIKGVNIAYDIIGDGALTAVITPGGRFSKDASGIRPLAERLAEEGLKVLIWDRPNCGASDLCFEGPSESIQNADMLAALLRALHLGPALLIGGSGGGRESLMTAIRHPELVSKLFLLWISGGATGIATLPMFYCADSVIAAATGGMEAVVELPGWREQLARNPGNRGRLLSLDPDSFIEKMQAWGWAFFPKEGVPLPGVELNELSAMRKPTLILRSGKSDTHHPRATSEALHALIPGAILAEPPWGDREWLERLAITRATGEAPFTSWPLLAPQILEFARSAN